MALPTKHLPLKLLATLAGSVATATFAMAGLTPDPAKAVSLDQACSMFAAKIQAALNAAGTNFTWHEFNGAHAFLRDEGYRYDPELAFQSYGLALNLFRRKLGEGDQRTPAPSGPA